MPQRIAKVLIYGYYQKIKHYSKIEGEDWKSESSIVWTESFNKKVYNKKIKTNHPKQVYYSCTSPTKLSLRKKSGHFHEAHWFQLKSKKQNSLRHYKIPKDKVSKSISEYLGHSLFLYSEYLYLILFHLDQLSLLILIWNLGSWDYFVFFIIV